MPSFDRIKTRLHNRDHIKPVNHNIVTKFTHPGLDLSASIVLGVSGRFTAHKPGGFGSMAQVQSQMSSRNIANDARFRDMYQGIEKGSMAYKMMSSMGWKEGEGLVSILRQVFL